VAGREAMTKLEPGWLMRTCHEAHISTMSTQMPDAVKHIYETPIPIPDNEARELYEKMDARFRAWTGKGLAQWQGEYR
jgi:hypothetical protein